VNSLRALFAGGERTWNWLAAVLRDAGHTVILPQEGAERRFARRGGFPGRQLFEDAIRGEERCEVVVAVLIGSSIRERALSVASPINSGNQSSVFEAI
jgi:hypothetical protein